MKTLSRFYYRVWRAAVLVLSLALLAYVLYFHRLGSLLPGYSTPELGAYTNSASWHAIAANPVNAPYKLFVWLTTAVGHHGLLMTRVVAASFGVLAVLAFFLIIRTWYGFRVAFLGTVLFATSAGFLHSARLGNGQILQMGVLAFMGAVLWYRRVQRHRILIGYAVIVLFALLWYVPGMIWFELFGLILLYRGLLRQLQNTSTVHSFAWVVLFGAIVAPLIVAAARTPHIFVELSGLPGSISALSHMGSNVLNAIMSVAVRSNGNALLWVGHAPLLDVIEIVLAAAGAYFYLYRERSLRTPFLVGATLISLTLIGFGGSVGFASLVPLLYLFVAHGLDQLLGQWLRVFPRNPIAKLTGIGLVCIMLGFSVLYQVRSYFVAWPHTAATRRTFNHPEP